MVKPDKILQIFPPKFFLRANPLVWGPMTTLTRKTGSIYLQKYVHDCPKPGYIVIKSWSMRTNLNGVSSGKVIQAAVLRSWMKRVQEMVGSSAESTTLKIQAGIQLLSLVCGVRSFCLVVWLFLCYMFSMQMLPIDVSLVFQILWPAL